MGDKRSVEERAKEIEAQRRQLQEGREKAMAVRIAIDRELGQRVGAIPGSYNTPDVIHNGHLPDDDAYSVKYTARNSNPVTMPSYCVKGEVVVQDNGEKLALSLVCYVHLGSVPDPNTGTNPVSLPVNVSCKKTLQIPDEVEEGSIRQWVCDVLDKFISKMKERLT